MNINKLFEGQREEIREISNKIWNANGKLTHNQVDDMLEQHFKQSFVKFLDSEIERLEHAKAIVSNIAYLTNPPQYPWNNNEEAVSGYNRAIADQITHLQKVKENIK